MKKYTEMTKEELMQEKTALEAEYEKIKNLGLSLDICLLYTSRCV